MTTIEEAPEKTDNVQPGDVAESQPPPTKPASTKPASTKLAPKRRAPRKKSVKPAAKKSAPVGIAGILSARADEATVTLKDGQAEIWECAAADRYTYVLISGAYGNRFIQRVKPGGTLRVSMQDRQAYCQEYPSHVSPYLNGRLEPVKTSADLWADFGVENILWNDVIDAILQADDDDFKTYVADRLTSRESVKRLVLAAHGAKGLSVAKIEVLRVTWDVMNRPASVKLDPEGRQRIGSESPDEEQGSGYSGSMLTADPNTRKLPSI